MAEMRSLFLSLFLMVGSLVPVGLWSASLEEDFLNPSPVHRPRVWWWFSYGVTKEDDLPDVAIIRDLEAMAAGGYGGFTLYVTPSDRNLHGKMRLALREANRLGLEATLLIGCACCVSPLTPPEHARKTLVSGSVRTKCGANEVRLPVGKDLGTILVAAVPVRDQPVSFAEVIDVTERFDDHTQTLRWQVPAGEWEIIRVGFAAQGRNPVYGGVHIDPMSRAAFDFHWQNVVLPFVDSLSPDERKALKAVCCDSWEGGRAEWTPLFNEEFRRLRGSDVGVRLVSLVDASVGLPDERESFRRDYNLTVSDLIAANHYAYQREVAARHGLVSIAQAAGPHQRQADVRVLSGRCDIPMGEFWKMSPHRPADSQRFLARDAATAAHVYGLPIVEAEAFTGIGADWMDSPRTLKQSADRAFCDGVTRLCHHGMALSPSMTDRPGFVRGVSSHINPQNTWFGIGAMPFNLYAARCSRLLSEGRFHADALVYAGDGIGVFAARKTPQDALGVGYDYDFCPTELLLKATVENGEIVLPSGMRYKVLILSDKNPDTARCLLPGKVPDADSFAPVTPFVPREARDAISSLRQRGAAVCETRTERAAWLAQSKLSPDFEVVDGESAVIDWIHRTSESRDIYFVANRANRPLSIKAGFRKVRKAVTLWNAVDGSRHCILPTSTANGITYLQLSFAPFASVFVVFDDADNVSCPEVPRLQTRRTLTGEWKVLFDATAGGPETPVVFSRLQDWSASSDPRIRHYSGVAEYALVFDVTAQDAEDCESLDLGTVREVAAVSMNGRDLGSVWTHPYRLPVKGCLQKGRNQLVVRVANLWPNRLIGDSRLPENERISRTNRNPFGPNKPLLPSGLLGPVCLQTKGSDK